MATGAFNPTSTDNPAEGRASVSSGRLGTDEVELTLRLEKPFPVFITMRLSGEDADRLVREAATAAYATAREAFLAPPEWARPKAKPKD